YGIDATWNDNNEFEIWDDAARCNGFGDPLPISLLRPIQTLLMNRASYEAQRESRPDERPYLLSRSGCPGIQRYAQTWSGDNFTSWNTLRYNIPMGLGLSLSGAPNTGHDVGGFAGPRPDPELLVRWVQNMIFQPRFCIHSWNTEGTANEPWMYPDMLPLVREAIQFRYRLIPYLYSLFVEAARTGHPIIRPMVYEFPRDACCHTESFDFMLGPNLLVASVLEAGMRTRSVYLPADTGWYDFYSGQHYEGRQTIVVDTPLERIPLFVPDGGIIPMGTAEVYVYPHPGTGRREFTLMEDDGISLGYQRGEYNTIQLLIESEPEQIKLDAQYLYRGYTGAYCKLAFVLPPDEHRSVQGGVRTMDKQGRAIFLLQFA
ncbi:MAG TPA: TIM-barrel domain-containing protein, partial [Aggregatilineaceae bacterium]|nr:TIM-barrel domain-containing protein [Aggregatilineaceae bacterium]